MSAELSFVLITLAALGASFALVAGPLLQRRGGQGGVGGQGGWARGVQQGDALRTETEATLEALRALEWDYELGNLEEEDYRALQRPLRQRALMLLREEERRRQELEQQIAELVAQRRAERALQASAPLLTTRTECPVCGHRSALGDRFCASCGTRLPLSTNGLARAIATRGPDARGPAAATAAPGRLSTASKHRGKRIVAVAGVAALGLFGALAAALLLAPHRAGQSPIGQLTTRDYHALFISPVDSRTVLFGHHDGLMASTDGGRSWQPLVSQRDLDFMALVGDPAEPSLLYAAGHFVFKRSTDGGRSWQDVPSDLPGLDIHGLTVVPGQPQVLYAFVVNHGLFRSTDGGEHWELRSKDVPSSTVALAAASGGHPDLYLAAPGTGVLASTDGGATWVSANGVLNGALPTRAVQALAFDPRSGESYTTSTGARITGTLYAGTDRGIYKSNDGGLSWVRLGLEAAVAALAIDPRDSRHIMAVDMQGRVWESWDRGLTWRGE